jgi:hypothetical protein
MSDPTEFLTCAVLFGLVVGAWAAIRECANAALHGKRNWWKRAIFRAQQRLAYREFSKRLDEVSDLERMGVDERP